jgi:hypothetical protein
MELSTKTRIGRHKVTFAEATIDMASIDAGGINNGNDVAIPGAEVGDVVTVNWDNETDAVSLSGYVSAKHVVTLVAVNATGSAIDPGSQTFYVAVHHRD